MIVHSIRIIAQAKRYINLPAELIDQLRKRLGLSLSAVWETFYKESDWNDGVLTRTHSYMAKKLGVSIRTVIRYIDKLIDLGFLKKKHNYDLEGRNTGNSYELDLPENVLQALKNAPDRKRPQIELEPDYSVSLNQDHIYPETEQAVQHTPETIKIIEAKSKPRQINEEVIKHNNIAGGSIGKILQRMKSTMQEREGVGCQDCHPSYNRLNQDINNTNEETEAAPITDLRQEEEPRNQEVEQKKIPIAVVNQIEKVVKALPGISNPSELVREAIHFVTNRKEGYSEWRAVGAFRKLLGDGGSYCQWRTPWGLKSSMTKYGDGEDVI